MADPNEFARIVNEQGDLPLFDELSEALGEDISGLAATERS